jgi:hypothetical protein
MSLSVGSSDRDGADLVLGILATGSKAAIAVFNLFVVAIDDRYCSSAFFAWDSLAILAVHGFALSV